MFFKIKEIFLLIFLILIQACSGGSIGNFLESSFDNIENNNKADARIKSLENKKNLNLKSKEVSKKNIETIKNKKEIAKNSLENKKNLNLKSKEDSKKNIETMKDKKDIAKNSLENDNFDKLQKTNKTRKANFAKKTPKQRKNYLQSYKIMVILKNVDPMDPIEDLSTILRNSGVNFEIERIERFIDSKK